MAKVATTTGFNWLNALRVSREMILPVALIGLIFVMLVRLPTGLMDVMLAANLAFAAIVLLTTVYVTSPLEFSVFPSMLLTATLFRLVLNCATTRLILTGGDNPAEATAAGVCQ